MTIKGMLIDISGTLVDKIGPGAKYVPGMVDLLDLLRSANITPVLVSNDLTQAGLEGVIKGNQPLHGALGLTRERIGKPKGSPLWIDTACDELKASPNELVYVGDSKYDMITASHRRVVYFHAGWARPHKEYGVNVDTPKELLLILKHVFLKNQLWHWSLDDTDQKGRGVTVRALIDGNGAHIPGLKSDLMSLKGGYDVDLGTTTLRQFIILHLLASMYLEGLCSDIKVWSTYPGSKAGANPLLEPLLDTVAKLFRAKLTELLIRHTPTAPSHRLRMEGKQVPFSHQTNSMRTTDDPSVLRRLEGATVLVFDDFITEGHAAELSRNWILRLGAAKVVCVAIGKYGNDYAVQTPVGTPSWDPSKANQELAFAERWTSPLPNAAALKEFREHYSRLLDESG